MSLVREGLSKLTAEVGYGSAGFSCKAAAGMGEETMAAGSDMPTHVGAERETNGAISTNMDQSKETGQLEWQHVESHHTVSASSIVWGEAPPVQHKLHVWPDLRQENPVDMRKQIFCNRSLNMKSIVAVGFDMDYTLAQYKPETFESMAYTGTIQKLVNDLGYPKELLDWKFDWKYMVRGLVLDKKRGSILKMDRHKYVKVAFHGFQKLTREERQATYGSTLSRESYDEPDYALIDTLFSLAEAYLFMQLVDFRDQFPGKIPSGTEVQCADGSVSSPNYAQMYKDVRAAVDLCHRDGTLKQAVAHEPSKYINEDRQLVPLLKMLRQSGRLTFLVTNSLWDYTHVVMNFLCGKCGTNGGIPRDDEWLSYFDIVVTGSAKPTFFQDGNRSPLFEVNISSGMLQNTDQGTPLPQIGGISLNTPIIPQRTVKQACKVFQGGSVGHLHRLLSIAAGAQVLYVGDHIYGDILRSKKELGWRTMLVVPELDFELEMLVHTFSIRKEISKLRMQRDALEDRLQHLEWTLRFDDLTVQKRQESREKIDILQVRSNFSSRVVGSSHLSP